MSNTFYYKCKNSYQLLMANACCLTKLDILMYITDFKYKTPRFTIVFLFQNRFYGVLHFRFVFRQ